MRQTSEFEPIRHPPRMDNSSPLISLSTKDPKSVIDEAYVE